MTITDAEQERRQLAVNFCRSNNRLEGIETPPELRQIEDRYIVGELDDAGFRATCLALARKLATNPDWNPQ